MKHKEIWRCDHCGHEIHAEELPKAIKEKHPSCTFKKVTIKREHNPLDNVIDHLNEHEKDLEHKHSSQSCNCDD